MNQYKSDAHRAILHLCYAAVNAAALKRNKFDPAAQAEVAEVLTKKIEQWIANVNCSVVELNPVDIQTYEYLCDILDNLHQTLPVVSRHFNVKLSIERFDYLEDHATTATHRDQGGEA